AKTIGRPEPRSEYRTVPAGRSSVALIRVRKLAGARPRCSAPAAGGRRRPAAARPQPYLVTRTTSARFWNVAVPPPGAAYCSENVYLPAVGGTSVIQPARPGLITPLASFVPGDVYVVTRFGPA